MSELSAAYKQDLAEGKVVFEVPEQKAGGGNERRDRGEKKEKAEKTDKAEKAERPKTDAKKKEKEPKIVQAETNVEVTIEENK